MLRYCYQDYSRQVLFVLNHYLLAVVGQYLEQKIHETIFVRARLLFLLNFAVDAREL